MEDLRMAWLFLRRTVKSVPIAFMRSIIAEGLLQLGQRSSELLVVR